MDFFEVVLNRRSIRRFKDMEIPEEIIDQILTAGIWAPSGMDNQPWRFAVIRDRELKSEIAKLTKYTAIFENAPVIIPVFVDHNVTYDTLKDAQTMGACLQNMLLAIHALGLVGVWIGEILKNGDKVVELCCAPKKYELMAVICVGYSAELHKEGKRKGLDEVVFLRK
jgi:nitroreductase